MEEAILAKKLVLVACDVVALSAVKFWRVVEPEAKIVVKRLAFVNVLVV